MNQFQINVQVTSGVSPELNSILAVLTRNQATAPAVEAAAPKKEKAPRPVEAATVKVPAPLRNSSK